ncbi:MAG: hypothetical protein JSW46_05850 [Gemmatimonadota bacterium]|nr:MAG: hypothetical protein JSW46_05850 [Gemmatimonadota bacterium]
MIDVTLTRSEDPFEFDVRVSEGNTETRHRVTMTESTYRKLSGGDASPERVIEAAFEFLLDREPKESILSSFDVTVISRYFPSFQDDIASYL